MVRKSSGASPTRTCPDYFYLILFITSSPTQLCLRHNLHYCSTPVGRIIILYILLSSSVNGEISNTEIVFQFELVVSEISLFSFILLVSR